MIMDERLSRSNRLPGSEKLTRPEEIGQLSKYLKSIKEVYEESTRLEDQVLGVSGYSTGKIPEINSLGDKIITAPENQGETPDLSQKILGVPGKTWEGFLCSCVFTAGLAVGLFYIPYFQSSGLALWQWIVMAILVEIFGLMGDLTESLFKRKAGVKDSGKIIPGHGGVLDRVDSILFATLPVYLFCLFFS